MAKDEVVRRRKRSRNGLGGYRDGGKGSQKGKVLATPFASKSGTVGKGPETIEKLRKARLSHLEKSPDELRMLSMRYLGESVHREVSTDAPIRKIATKPSHRSASESKRRRHRKPRSTEGSVDDKEYVYGQSQAKNPEPNSKSKYIKSSARVLPTVVEEAEAPAPQARKQSRQRHATDHSVEQDVTSGTSNSGSSTINVRNKTQRRESDPIRSLSVPAQRPPSPPRRHSSSVRRFVFAHAFAAFANLAHIGPLPLVEANTHLPHVFGEVPQACLRDKSRQLGSHQSAPSRQLRSPQRVREGQLVYLGRS